MRMILYGLHMYPGVIITKIMKLFISSHCQILYTLPSIECITVYLNLIHLAAVVLIIMLANHLHFAVL